MSAANTAEGLDALESRWQRLPLLPIPILAPMFTCSDFNPQEWASLFKASGARGLTMTSKHHEGWTLWPNPRHANCAKSDNDFHLSILR